MDSTTVKDAIPHLQTPPVCTLLKTLKRLLSEPKSPRSCEMLDDKVVLAALLSGSPNKGEKSVQSG